MSPSSVPKKRTAHTDEEKRLVRQYYQRNAQSTSQKEIIRWAKDEHGIEVRQNTVSLWLSDKYLHLDENDHSRNPLAKRRRERPLHTLEMALYEWTKRMERKITISGETLKLKAAMFYERMDIYQGQETPKFSNGWLQGFQKSYNIKWGKQHGELGSTVELNVDEEIVRTRYSVETK
jgi:Tc5 transposase DNA-binding domain/Fission yeast centromere protein N-terminal domain